jgi:hypothetical protein
MGINLKIKHDLRLLERIFDDGIALVRQQNEQGSLL